MEEEVGEENWEQNFAEGAQNIQQVVPEHPIPVLAPNAHEIQPARRLNLMAALNHIGPSDDDDLTRNGNFDSETPTSPKKSGKREVYEWRWDKSFTNENIELSEDQTEVLFHPLYSNGTAAMRGDTPLTEGQHYWEVKITTYIYGTDVMLGIGTEKLKPENYSNRFMSLLGADDESWGLSYAGSLIHQKLKRNVCSRLMRGSIIGMHLDMWNGTLSIYKNGRYQGVAFSNLRGKRIYPYICSTAARTGMKLLTARRYDSNLQYTCLLALRRNAPRNVSLADAFDLPKSMIEHMSIAAEWLVRPYGEEMDLATYLKRKHDFPNKFDLGDGVKHGEEVSTKSRRLTAR